VRLICVSMLVLLLGCALALSHGGNYGWTLFVSIPVLAGALAGAISRPTTVEAAVRDGAITGAAGCGLFLLLGAEGFICVLMAMPIVIPLAILGSVLIYWCRKPRKSPAAMALLLPVSLFYDAHSIPPVYSVTTSIAVNAPPERVWKSVVAFPDIPGQPDWALSTGFAYPLRTRIDGTGIGAPRHCDLSTGTVEERVVAWDEPHRLRFLVTATPPAMREMGVYGPIYPKHLDGYYISKQGEFELTPLPGGRTLVTGTSWYQHGLWPASYWRLWSDLVVHHIHRRVLKHIRALSERPAYSSAGNSKTNEHPLSRDVSRRSVPPFASTAQRAIDSPRPLPPFRFERAGSTR
jgi:hypothetical protein